MTTVLFYLSRPPYCFTCHDHRIVLLGMTTILFYWSGNCSTLLFTTAVCLQIYCSLQLNSSTFRDICVVVVFYWLENSAVLDSLFHCALHLYLIYSSRDSCRCTFNALLLIYSSAHDRNTEPIVHESSWLNLFNVDLSPNRVDWRRPRPQGAGKEWDYS